MSHESLLKQIWWAKLCLANSEKPCGGMPPWMLEQLGREAMELAEVVGDLLERWGDRVEPKSGQKET